MGALISLFIQLIMLTVRLTLSLTTTLINLFVLLLARSAKRPRQRGFRPKGGVGSLVSARQSKPRGSHSNAGTGRIVLGAFILLIIAAAVPRLAVFLILLVIAVAAIRWLTKRSRRYRTMEASELANLFQNVRLMDGRQFEAFMANLFRAMGYETTMLGGSGDQGVDILVKMDGQRVAVQCKNYAKPVGNKPVQEVYAGAQYHGCSRAWVVAPAGYTKGAVDLAQRVGVLLYDANSIRSWIGQVEATARSREKAAAESAAPHGRQAEPPSNSPRGIWHPHPDDAPNQNPPTDSMG